MTARELFAVYVRVFGLILLTIGLMEAADEIVNLFRPDVVNTAIGFDVGYAHRAVIRNLWKSAIFIVPGAAFLFSPKLIVRLVYGPQP